MKPKDNLDCVQMKWDIQQKLLEEERLFGPEEAHRRQDERVRNDPILSRFVQRMDAEERKRASELLEHMAGES